jgi:phosphatidylserine/phosphatidylglycerophosphate/cardiolipin synthase-like enzyme
VSQKINIVTPLALSETSSATLCAPWFVQRTEFPPMPASYRPLVNGKEAFGAVYDAILAAKHTVDIICWGFQPSMYFKRDGGDALCIGDLLIKKGLQGVKVRLLCWADSLAVAQFQENPTPGYSPLRSLSMQNDDGVRRAYDRTWYQHVRAGRIEPRPGDAVPYTLAEALRPQSLTNIELVTRDFSLLERLEIMYRQSRFRADKELGAQAYVLGFGAVPSHHQKMVLIDFEAPEQAVGFVMGHNMLDGYWDDDRHRHARSSARFGRNGEAPLQDMSALVTGPVLEYLNVNFCRAWRRSTQVDLIAKRKPLALRLKVRRDLGTAVMAQITRTQSQEGRQDIKALYLQTVSNATQFIYIENQYFRWEPLAAKIKEIAQRHVEWGRDPGKHGPIHLFVVTNSTDGAMGTGTVSTYQMLESLGRADVMPAVARLERQDRLLREGQSAKNELVAARLSFDANAPARREAAQQKLDETKQKLHDNRTKPILPTAIPGLKIHVCTLVAPDSPPEQWLPVYVHSKIMIVDDVFLTHGSANINTRSMEVDSELNICHEHNGVTAPLRRRLWDMHTGGMGAQDDPIDAFEEWGKIIDRNEGNQTTGQAPCASLVGFMRTSPKRTRLD